MEKEIFDELEETVNCKISELEAENEELQKQIDLHEACCRVVDAYYENTELHKVNCEELFSECIKAVDTEEAERKIRENRLLIKDMKINLLKAVQYARSKSL